MDSREIDLEADLESGGTTSEEDGCNDPVPSSRQRNKMLSGFLGGFLDCNESVEREHCNWENSNEVATDRVELLIDRSPGRERNQEYDSLVEEKCVKEKHNKSNSKRASKPPRPPKGPLLDATDQKLVKEISERAMRKRERIERMKALKKMKAAKRSSSSSSLSAMIITIIFFVIIIFQGISSRSSPTEMFQGSPERALASSEDFISVHYYQEPSPSERNGSGPKSFEFVQEESTGSRTRQQAGRSAG